MSLTAFSGPYKRGHTTVPCKLLLVPEHTTTGSNWIWRERDCLLPAFFVHRSCRCWEHCSSLSILHDGTPGAWEYVAPPNPLLVTLDGIAFDVTGRLWFTVNYGSDGSGGKLGTLDEDGKLRILADSTGWLDYPTMVVFGTTCRDRDTLYLTNGGLNGGKPNVLSFDVEVAGLPLPAEH